MSELVFFGICFIALSLMVLIRFILGPSVADRAVAADAEAAPAAGSTLYEGGGGMLILYAMLIGFALDLLFGDPVWLPHPVVGMGKLISCYERRIRPLFPTTPRGELLGGALMVEQQAPSLGVESFCYFLEHTPGVYYDLGCGVGTGLHTPTFCVDESVIGTGIALQVMSVLRLLKHTW